MTTGDERNEGTVPGAGSGALPAGTGAGGDGSRNASGAGGAGRALEGAHRVLAAAGVAAILWLLMDGSAVEALHDLAQAVDREVWLTQKGLTPLAPMVL